MDLAPENQFIAHTLHPAIEEAAANYIRHRYGVEPTIETLPIGCIAVTRDILARAAPAGVA